MSTFDIVINFIEACTYIGFIYFVLHKSKKILSLSVFIFIYFINTTLHNYYLLPEISLTLTNCTILFLYSHLINKNHLINNIFITLLTNILLSISNTLSMVFTRFIFTFPFYDGLSYVTLAILTKIINIIICIFAFYFIKKSEILNLKTNKIKYVLVALLFLSFIYTSCIEIIFYNQIFNYHMIIILISINLLTLFLCYIFLETQKEQKLLLKLQRDQLKRENESKINLINQKNVTHLNSWKHDITYIFSYLKKYIENHKYDEALKTISIYTDVLNNYNLLVNTNNDILNSVLIEYNDIIIKNNIHFYINLKQTNIPLNEEDYRWILETLLEEAIKNCENQKEIWISILQKDSNFYLSFEFDCSKNTQLSLYEQISSHLDKYNGLMKEVYELEKYKVTILIPLL